MSTDLQIVVFSVSALFLLAAVALWFGLRKVLRTPPEVRGELILLLDRPISIDGARVRAAALEAWSADLPLNNSSNTEYVTGSGDEWILGHRRWQVEVRLANEKLQTALAVGLGGKAEAAVSRHVSYLRSACVEAPAGETASTALALAGSLAFALDDGATVAIMLPEPGVVVPFSDADFRDLVRRDPTRFLTLSVQRSGARRASAEAARAAAEEARSRFAEFRDRFASREADEEFLVLGAEWLSVRGVDGERVTATPEGSAEPVDLMVSDLMDWMIVSPSGVEGGFATRRALR